MWYVSEVLSIAEGLPYLSFTVKAQLVTKNVDIGTHDYIVKMKKLKLVTATEF